MALTRWCHPIGPRTVVLERWALEIDRDDIRSARIVADAAAPLGDGRVEARIDLVALTANNITYAALGKPNGFLGEDAGYWDFFADRDAPGRLPVWGFATVTASRVDHVTEGETLYGYWPLASHAVLQPDRIGAVGFVEASERRARLPALYNSYQRVAALADHRAADHAHWPVWRPLQITGWLVADQMADEGDHGAAQVLVTAASSKTALAFAHAYRARRSRSRLIALTSARSASFVRLTGLYDAVVTYDELSRVASIDTVLVDFANAEQVVADVRAALGSHLLFDLVVGFTHWDAAARSAWAAPPRTAFFAPDRIAKRGREWGGEALRARLATAWRDFMRIAPSLARLDERRGPEAALAAYQDTVTGRADPAVAMLLRP